MNPAIKICWGNENELTTKHADDEKEIGSNFIKLSICNAVQHFFVRSDKT